MEGEVHKEKTERKMFKKILGCFEKQAVLNVTVKLKIVVLMPTVSLMTLQQLPVSHNT
jgi:hypothetical protein